MKRDVSTDDFLILAQCGTREIALLVDKVCDVAAREAMMAHAENLAGLEQESEAVTLAGEVILIQDLSRFLSEEEDAVLRQALSARDE